MYAEYKAHRAKMPEEMRSQMERVRQVVDTLGMPVFELEGYEADDLLGTLAQQASAGGQHADRHRRHGHPATGGGYARSDLPLALLRYGDLRLGGGAPAVRADPGPTGGAQGAEGTSPTTSRVCRAWAEDGRQAAAAVRLAGGHLRTPGGGAGPLSREAGEGREQAFSAAAWRPSCATRRSSLTSTPAACTPSTASG